MRGAGDDGTDGDGEDRNDAQVQPVLADKEIGR